MKSERILAAFREILAESKLSPQEKIPKHLNDEAGELIAEFLEDVFDVVCIQEIERRVLSVRTIDVKAIEEAIAIIKNSNPKEFAFKFEENKERIVNPTTEIADLEKSLGVIKDGQTRLGQLEVLLRIELFFDGHLNDLMICLEGNEKAYEDIHKLVLSKLNKLKNDQILLLWARLKNQFLQDDRRSGFINYPEIIPSTFWSDTNDVDVLRDRYAWFITKYKPLTIKRMVSEGHNMTPAGLPGIARVLGLAENVDGVSNIDMVIMRLGSKIAAIYNALTYSEPSDLARAVGADPSSMIFDGEFYHEFKTYLGKEGRGKSLDLLFVNAMRLFELAKEATVNQSTVATSLWNYKLGQEVIAPEQTKQIKAGKRNELALQKEMSKFLVERGILSFGRTFGRSEIDLYTKESPSNEFVIEVKVYKKRPSESIIRSHVTQLLSYMDQIAQPQGILAIYNCTDDLIISPRKWLKGRVWILSLNIGEAPPSGRDRSLEIRESKDPREMFLCIENGGTAKKPRKTKTSKSKRRKS